MFGSFIIIVSYISLKHVCICAYVQRVGQYSRLQTLSIALSQTEQAILVLFFNCVIHKMTIKYAMDLF